MGLLAAQLLKKSLSHSKTDLLRSGLRAEHFIEFAKTVEDQECVKEVSEMLVD